MTYLDTLTPDALPALARFWREAFPSAPLDEALLRERVFGPPDYAPERALTLRDGGGEIILLALIVPPGPAGEDEAAAGGLRAFGVHPGHRGQGLGRRLLKECEDRLARLGAEAVDFLATPPCYIRPGVDIRETGTIAWLLRRGFEHHRSIFNMTVELGGYAPLSRESIEGPDAGGYIVRRAGEDDRETLSEFISREWTQAWALEAAHGLAHDPVSVYLAFAPGGGELAGFAAYEVSQCTGSFGPAGVSPAHRGRGLGKRLLHATLADMKSLGRARSEIGWVGPVDFYHRACGARLGPSYWWMRKRLAP